MTLECDYRVHEHDDGRWAAHAYFKYGMLHGVGDDEMSATNELRTAFVLFAFDFGEPVSLVGDDVRTMSIPVSLVMPRHADGRPLALKMLPRVTGGAADDVLGVHLSHEDVCTVYRRADGTFDIELTRNVNEDWKKPEFRRLHQWGCADLEDAVACLLEIFVNGDFSQGTLVTDRSKDE